MEYELKQYIRDEQNCPIGVMIATVNEENPIYVHIGVSLCHEHDKFNKIVGYNLTKNRIKNPNSWHKIKKFKYKYSNNIEDWDMDINKIINYFINRCSAYFKNKMIVLPKIKYI